MHWLRRIRRGSPREAASAPPGQETPGSIERSAPGIAALFSGLREDGSHTVLDMGAGSERSFALYSRFARRIRFADLLKGPPPQGGAWAAALRDMPPPQDGLYDVVMAWNLLDRLNPAGRLVLVERLAQLTTLGARLYVLVDASGEPNPRPQAFTLLGTDRVAQEPVGPPHPAYPQLLPAEVERLLRPFEVVQAFTLRRGFREYVAFRR